MPSRQDELHSHQFAIRRVVAAVVAREADPAQLPLRRTGGAALVGVLLAALSIGAVAVYGLLSPGGSDRWKRTNAVIVEKETGALYVYRSGRLHPVPNFASARLILRAADAKTVAVARRSIGAVPRGAPMGLDGAPESLPDRSRLVRAPWQVCAASSLSVVVLGATVAGSTLGDRGLLVTTPDGATHLVWHHRRYRVRPDALAALAWGGALPVAPAFASALPAGPDLSVPVVPARGGAVRRMPEARAGQVYAVERAGGGDDLMVAVPDGLASVTRLQADLLLASGPSGDGAPVRLSRARFNAVVGGAPVPPLDPSSTSGDNALPPSAPLLATGTGPVCAGTGQVLVGAILPDLTHAVTVVRPPGAGVLVDRVVVPPGAGALVEAVASPSGPGTWCLVTDLGVRYALAGPEVATMLGYGDLRPVRLPAEIVALLPAGVVLDPSAIA